MGAARAPGSTIREISEPDLAPTAMDRTVATRLFVASAPIAIAMTDRDIRFLQVSERFLTDLGITEEAMLGRTAYDLAPEARDRYLPLHQRCLAGESVSGFPDRIVLPGGDERWLTWDLAPWRDDQGEVGGLLILSRDVTAQVAAEQEVRRTHAFLDRILQNTPTPLVVKDQDGRILIMNRAMEELYGVSASAHVGRRVSDVVSPDHARRIYEEDQVALAMDGPLMIEEMISGPDGPRHVHRTKIAIRDGDGASYLLAVSEDVTDRMRTQQELERTRAFLETLIESVPIALVVKDTDDGRIVVVNRANEVLMGMPREDMIGKTAHDLFPPEQAEWVIGVDRQVLASGQLHVNESVPLTTPHNGVRFLRQMKVPIRAPDGSSYVLTISEDITERRQAAEELQRTQSFLETVIENVPAGLAVKDAETGQLIMTNPAVEEMYGVERGENLGKTVREIIKDEQQAARSLAIDREVLESGEVKVVEAEPITTRNGVRFLRKKKIAMRNADGRLYLLSISEDVTERKRAEDALKEAVARAEAANVAKSEFLANMSHEIRTPLNGVLGLADALAGMDLTPEQAEIVGLIVSSGKALTEILSDVLDLAKAEAGQLELQPKPFSLSEVIGSASYLFATAARAKGLDFQVHIESGDLDRLVGDPLRIRQIVSNLISNAVKFTAHGQVVVRAHTTAQADGDVALEVSVTDTGPGFTEEVRARLFSRFEQGDGSITRRYGGTGLGLSIAGALAEMMGGEISCCATPGKGAHFVLRVVLKVARALPKAAAPAPTRASPGAGHRLRVLLAEDHEVNQKVVQLMLDGCADIVLAADGEQALNAFLNDGPFDVVLMDSQMPVMDGLTATREIRQAEVRLGRIRTPIISLTANAMAHQVEACREAGADFHLAKPITTAGLMDVLDEALDAGDANAEAPASAQTA